ncbi:hypothetical protein MLD38_034315 [Melastoma candidum]|uniref:Uncharacterized protein n=1 Tax=Melastoma candidum TaxID=119954 RepID=A0ACB9M9I6_9MYRT|nr:hypothetical protein MLD38_034315 [Melastoma candidum]
MVSSSVNGQDLGSVSGKMRGVARCDNVISWACAADYGDSSLAREGTADGTIYQGCCDGFSAPSSHAEEAEGACLHRASEPSCQANGNISDCSESCSNVVASEPNKGQGFSLEPNRGHDVVSESNEAATV